MDLTNLFENLLQTSADGFVWGVEQIPEERRYIQPPNGLGEWSVARHVFHLRYYEQTLALPSIRQWAGEAPTALEESVDLSWDRSTNRDLESLLAEYRKVRQQQIQLIAKFDESQWSNEKETVWGAKSLLWVVSKTYQHTAEHISDVMRIGLFWDRFAR